MTGVEQLWERLEAYARSYLPWWRTVRESQEPEAALLWVLGSLLEDTSDRLARLPEKHEAEFLRAFGLVPQKARPALAWAALSAPKSVFVPAGTEFYLSGNGTRRWRTCEDVTASPCRLVRQVLVGGKSGRLLPVPPPEPGSPTRLFDFRAKGQERREARFSHPDAFSSQKGCEAALVLPEASGELTAFLAGGQVRWFLGGGGMEIPLKAPQLTGDRLRFCLPPSPEAKYLLVRISDGIAPAGPVGAVYVEACREGLPAESVLTGEDVPPEESFLPFGEEPSPWRTCHLASEDAFSLRGAEVTLSWTASLGSLERPLPGAERERPLKAVMRRLPPEPPEPREVYADTVSWEYWDGLAWSSIPGTERYRSIFGPLENGPAHFETRFPWPRDAAQCDIQGHRAYWLRWRLCAAEGWEALPKRSRCPEVSGLRFDAVLRNAPVAVEHCCGLEDAFTSVRAGEPLFPALTGPWDEWWLGFEAPPKEETPMHGTLDLWLTLEGRTPGCLSAWEAKPRGERRVSLTDGTGGLSHSGTLSLRGLAGEPGTRFGQKLWWLCLRDESGQIAQSGVSPVLTAIDCGAVLVQAEGGGHCSPGEALRPLRGGVVRGNVLTGDFGGSAGEEGPSLERARSLRCFLGRGTSEADIGRLLRDELPDVVRTRCVRTEEVIEVGVLLRDVAWHSAAFASRREELLRILEQRSVLPALGVRIAVREPCFYAVHTSVWLSSGQDASALRRRASEALERYLDPVAGGPDGRGWSFGRLPRAEELAALLRDALPEAKLTGLLCAAVGPDGRETDTDAVCDPFALPVNGTHTVSILEGGTL